jgi:hypothetical protein
MEAEVGLCRGMIEEHIRGAHQMSTIKWCSRGAQHMGAAGLHIMVIKRRGIAAGCVKSSSGAVHMGATETLKPRSSTKVR